MGLGSPGGLELCASIISAGEAGALLVGMRDGAGPSSWMTASNVAYSATDIAFGLGVGALELGKKGDTWYAQLALGAMAIGCGARAIEYAAGGKHPFCANSGLLAVDILKLLLAAGAVAAALLGK